MRHTPLWAVVLVLLSAALAAPAQTPPAPRVIPRPLLKDPQAPAGNTNPDGYAPIPEWLGQTRAPRPARTAEYDVETVVTGVTGGFSFHFLPDGRIILSERAAGRIRIAQKDGRLSEPIAGLPPILAGGPQGMFEVRPDRDFGSNRILYFCYAAAQEGALREPPRRLPGVMMVARARLSADEARLEDVRVLLNADGIEGRLIQAPDGTLFITSGVPAGVGINSADWPQPQQLDSNMGKVLRIAADGSIPRDNPFVGRAGARPEIYAYGLREDQGVAIHPRTGRLWASENGPKGGDEINLVEPGANYGFPLLSYGREYSGQPVGDGRTAAPGMKQPVYFWTPSIAPSGMTFYAGALFPAWQGDLFVAALAGRHLVRLVLDGERVVGEERLLTALDTRMRDVREGPDGALYVLTDGNDGRILRLVPARAR
ncbi:MAG: PQQ-dependent sugar dehydrogenase [Gemmatimonadetes bacterium]|nr:PQQ-dependent sugar dehydrogenase [Gemmatimonadota bacterium]